MKPWGKFYFFHVEVQVDLIIGEASIGVCWIGGYAWNCHRQPVNYDKMDALFNHHPEYVKSFQKLIFEMSLQLRIMAEVGSDQSKFSQKF